MNANSSSAVREHWVHAFPSGARCEMRLHSNNRLEFNWLRRPNKDEAGSKQFRLMFRTWMESVGNDIAKAYGVTVLTFHEPQQSKMVILKPKQPTAL